MKKKIEFYDPDYSMTEPINVREWCCFVPVPNMTIVLDDVEGATRAYRLVDIIIVGDEDDFYWRLTVSEVGG